MYFGLGESHTQRLELDDAVSEFGYGAWVVKVQRVHVCPLLQTLQVHEVELARELFVAQRVVLLKELPAPLAGISSLKTTRVASVELTELEQSLEHLLLDVASQARIVQVHQIFEDLISLLLPSARSTSEESLPFCL